ncbi:hypothetical protein CesoFtcFv8_010712 [Champsocephalus esox]|uniref:Uncharacterized protein n=1 Tax=Champsocephalus esox TaxID=159716 RepID=A0AAN8C153_9TELE|nr:hypothetical protein CesoFtcFv8_010712 [Champsocephalus esox]
MVVAPKALLQKVGDFVLEVDGCSISPSPEARNLGVILDSTLSYHSHVKSVTKPAFYHLRNIARLRPSLSESVAETLVHAFVTTRLDYCNGVLFGVPNKTPDRLHPSMPLPPVPIGHPPPTCPISEPAVFRLWPAHHPPRTKLRTFGDRAFSVAAPTLWNALPAEIRNIPTLDAFKKALKSHLFIKAFGP